MRITFLLVLASCCLLVYAAQSGNEQQPKGQGAVTDDLHLDDSGAKSFLTASPRRKLMQLGCGVYKNCIYVQNLCNVDLKVVIRYKTLSDVWITDGVWRLYPGKRGYLVDTTNRYIYFHAQSDDLSRFFGDDYFFNFGSKTLPFTVVNTGSTFTTYLHIYYC